MDAKLSEWRPGPNVCRCCLTEGCYKDISTEYFWMGKREVYAEMLSETFDLTIAYSKSGGPNSNSRLICENCIARLRDATDFKRQVKECEKTFIQHLDPGNNAASEIELRLEPQHDKTVKLESVKLEKRQSDDDFDDRNDFATTLDDDEDDLDDQPLLKLASKTPKKESENVDILDLLDNAKVTEKRKSSAKSKEPPTKKLKKKEPLPKPSASKSLSTEKKKKGQHRSPGIETDLKSEEIDVNPITMGKRNYQRSARSIARLKTKRNASAVLECWTVSPFRWQKNRFKCAYCEDQFTECSILREHVSICSKSHSFRDIYSKFKEMSLINVDLTDAACRVCTIPLVNIDSMRVHIAQHGYWLDPQHPDGVIPFNLDNRCWKCVVCQVEFNNFLKLYEHMNVHYQHYICDICGKGYMTAQRLRKHSEAHATGPFACNECDKIFNTRASRESHRANHHIKGPKYQCPKCDMRFDGYYDRMNHLNETHREKEVVYNCPHCELKFKTSGKRSAHVRSIHFPPLRTHGCSYCDWNFKTAYELKRHTVKHTGERNFHCLICGKSYPRSKTLKEHMRIHDHDRIFNCKWCGCEYKQKAKLLRHVRTSHPQLPANVTNDDKIAKSNSAVHV